MYPNIHLLGIQGSGKGTQASLLVEDCNISYASSGNIFRERTKIKDELGLNIAKEMNSGKLLSTELLISTVRNYCASHIISNGLLGDGIIRTIDQYKQLQNIWEEYKLDQPLLIYFNLKEEEALNRN